MSLKNSLSRLPDRYQKKISTEVTKLEEDYKMPYVTSWERIAKKEGKKEGKKEEKLETANRMLNDGVSIEDIAKYTGLPEKEIKRLIQ
jgi:predicted transposase/invertase (TIGR01784 family)